MQNYSRPNGAGTVVFPGEAAAHNTRGAAKRQSQEAVMDQQAGCAAGKRRAAFGDITNQHSDLIGAEKDPKAQQISCQGAFGLLQQGFGTASLAPVCTRPDVVDIDAEDVDDPMACTEIVNDIFEHLRRAEMLRRPSTCYMESVQTDINPMMRSILVDWLVEVAQEYRLTSDTLFLSVAYIDRFLSLMDVRRNKLQLVGVTCMLVASKYEEIYAPAIDEFCYITDNTYTREQVLSMEGEILRVLEFDLTQPTIKTFLRRYIKAASGEIALDATYEFLCAYLAELTLMDYGMLHYLPSHVAASIVLVALYMLNKPTWSPTLQFYTGHMPRDLRRCAQAVHSLFVQAKSSSLPASREKYASSKFASVSQLGTADNLPEWLFCSQ